MFLVFPTTIICSFLQSIPVLADSFSPSFNPYCLRSSSCRQACHCSSPQCTLLLMEDETRGDILHHHNRIRNSQTENLPQPSGLALLEYDLDLEEVSTCWAARCENDASKCFKTPSFRRISQTVGQMILEEDESPDRKLWIQMMDTWLVLLEDLPLELLHLNHDSKDLLEHNLAQILSDRILYVGCAWSLSFNWIFFVCSYGPRGPLPGDDIYAVGDLCSTCPEGYECSDVEPFDRLCKSKSYRQEEILGEHLVNMSETNRNQRMEKRKSSRMRKFREGNDDDPYKKKKKDNTPFLVGAGVFFSLLFFFGLFGAYTYVVSRVNRDVVEVI